MRRGLRIAAAFGMLLLAVCRKWDNPFDPANNHPPARPAAPFPDSNAQSIDTSVVLRWIGADPDTLDTLVYDVYFGTSSAPPLAETCLRAAQYHPGGLTALTQYHWRVVARDLAGAATSGSVWSFRTGIANSPPNAPAYAGPDSNGTGVWHRPTLVWTCTDPNPNDTLFYDVYFGTTSSPPLIVQRQRQNTHAAGALLYDTTYYWKIIASDQKGAQRQGPVWRFRTAASIRVVEPNDSTRWPVNSEQAVRWTGGPTIPAPDSTVVLYSSNGGTSWMRHGRATLSGRYDWRVPGPIGTNARVRVRLHVGSDTNYHSSPSYQVLDTQPPTPITVTSPAAGTRWVIGTQHDITWTGGTDGMDSTVIFYTTDAGITWTRQGVTRTAGRFAWIVPEPVTANARVLVRAHSMLRYVEGLSGTFVVTPPPYPDTVVATITVGTRPRALVWDAVGGKLFVANYASSTVSVVDGATNGLIGTVNTGPYPYALCLDSIDRRVYVANSGGNSVTVIDAVTHEVVTTVPVGMSPQAICWNAANNKVYVANKNSATVTVIDGASSGVLATVPVDSSPLALVWCRTANAIYTANFARNNVTVIDGSSNNVVTTINVGYAPAALALDSNDYVAVANRNAGTVSIINTGSNTVRATINVESEPWAMVASRASQRLYVANSASSRVSIINTANYTYLSGISVASHPRCAEWASWVDKIYVGAYDERAVSIIDGATGALLKTLAVGNKPTAIVANRRDGKVYVANYDDGTVTVIGPSAR